jgi:hypothetical protein
MRYFKSRLPQRPRQTYYFVIHRPILTGRNLVKTVNTFSFNYHLFCVTGYFRYHETMATI